MVMRSVEIKDDPLKRQRKHWICYLSVFFCFLTVYVLTAQRGVGWQDSGEFQYRALIGDYTWHSGIARAHPLYVALTQLGLILFSWLNPFYAMNLVSGLGLAVALTLLAIIVKRLTGQMRAAIASVCVLGLAHMAWWLGTIAEVYTWALAFVMAEVGCLIRYGENRKAGWLVLLFAVNGLHWSLHSTALLGLPVYVWVLSNAVIADVKRGGTWWQWLLLCALCWTVGGGLVLWQALQVFFVTGKLATVIESVLFGNGYGPQVLGVGGFSWAIWKANMALAGMSLLNPGWVLVLRGLYMGGGQVRSWLLALTVLHGIFWIRYFVADQAMFVLPTLGLGAVWLGLGAAACRKRTLWILLVAGVIAQVAIPPWLNRVAGKHVGRSRELPFRNETRYWLIPWKQNEMSAQQFADAVNNQMKAGDILFADSTTAASLMAIREFNKDAHAWRLISPWTGEDVETLCHLAEQQNLLVVSPVKGYTHGVLLEKFEFDREGVLWRARKRE